MKKEAKKKHKVIKNLVPKADLALKNEFYLDASWILSTIIEAKLRRIITIMMNENPGLGFGPQKCLRQIKLLRQKGIHPLLDKHLKIRLIDELRLWLNHRNSIYKDLMDIHVSKARIKKMAEEGTILYQELNLVYKSLKKDWTKELIKDSLTYIGPIEDISYADQ